MELQLNLYKHKPSSTTDDLGEKLENLAKHYNWLIRAKLFKRKSSDGGKNVNYVGVVPVPKYLPHNEESLKCPL
jgi:hypothetical protein